MPRLKLKTLYWVVFGVVPLCCCELRLPQAQAAGLFLAPRGVRPLARAGAFVAGADDLHALSYNPAGLAQARRAVLLDFGLPLHDTTYTRSITGDAIFETPTSGHGLGVPSPTLGIVHDLGLAAYGLHFGLGVGADYPLMQNWPDATDQPLTPQRYAIGSFDGTAIAKLCAGVGYRVLPSLSLGAAAQFLVGSFSSQSTLSTCDGVSCTQPENPAYDITIQMQAKGLVVPGVSLGLQLDVLPWLRFGLAWETGYDIATSAIFRIRLPSAPAYAGATLQPAEPRGQVTMRLPQVARAGLEARWQDLARLEASFVYEPWSVHDAIDVTVPDATLQDVFAMGTYKVGGIALQRGFRDTWSARLGGEMYPSWGALAAHRPLTLRAGLMFEPSAVPIDMMTPMSVDLDKLLVTLGTAFTWGAWQFEASAAQVFMWDRLVTHGQVTQSNPTRPSFAGVTAVGNGLYQSHASVIGAGVRYAL